MKTRTSLPVLLVLFVAHAQVARAGDAPEISRSPGAEGGVVVLWPRIIPRSEAAASRALALSVQKRLEALVRSTLPGRPIDVRPEPERVCRRAGCKAMTVGALLARRRSGCVLVALVSRPGQSAAQLVPWVGDVTLKKAYAPFREPPESQVTIVDFEKCDQVASSFPAHEPKVVAALRAAATSAP